MNPTPAALAPLIVCLYLFLNVSLNVFNKWMLSSPPTGLGFHFPILLSISHAAFSFLALAPFFLATKQQRETHLPVLSRQWLGLLCCGFFFAINLGFNNASLLAISLTLNQIIRASIPVVTAAAAVVVESRVPSRQEFVALTVLVVGVAISVHDSNSSKGTFGGVVLCFLGTICNGLMVTSTGKMLADKMERLDVLRLTFYTAPVTLCVLVPFYLRLEAAKYAAYSAANGSAFLGVLLVGCATALAYNVVHSLVIKVASSVTTVVVSEMKIVVILLLSAIILGEADVWNLKMVIGCTTAILGFCLYSHCRLLQGAAPFQPIIKGMPELAPSLSEPRTPLLPSREPPKGRG